MAAIGAIPAAPVRTLVAAVAANRDRLIDPARVEEIEATTRHDVIAFLTHVEQVCGAEARFLHLGMTSSDLLDTTLAIQLERASDLILVQIDAVLDALERRAFEHKRTPTIGRSHVDQSNMRHTHRNLFKSGSASSQKISCAQAAARDDDWSPGGDILAGTTDAFAGNSIREGLRDRTCRLDQIGFQHAVAALGKLVTGLDPRRGIHQGNRRIGRCAGKIERTQRPAVDCGPAQQGQRALKHGRFGGDATPRLFEWH